LVTFALGFLGVEAQAGPPAQPPKSRIRFRNGEVQTIRKSASELATAANAVVRSGGNHFVIQFSEPVSDATRAKLAAAGVSLQSYVGDNAYFATRRANFDAAALSRVATLHDVEPIQSTWKLHPDYVRGTIPEYSIARFTLQAANSAPQNEEQRKLAALEGQSEEPAGAAKEEVLIASYVMFHPDVPLQPNAVNLALRYGGVVRSVVAAAHMLVVEFPLENLQLLAGEDEVMWVEPPLPGFSELNAENRAITGANIVQAAPYNLSGAGVKVLVYDGGTLRTTHVDFQGRVVNGPEPACETVSDHSTHVAGTIGGAGVAVANNRGMAPGVTIIGHAYNQVIGSCALSQGFLYNDPGDMEQDYTDAITSGAVISNNSIGTNTAPNGYPCDWEGNYGATSVVIDSIVRGTPGVTNGQPFRVVWANGNERQSTRCGTTYRTTAPPACAKNHITVGALNANDDSITSFTSWGPADDGRMKPDISGPGCQVGGDNGVTSCSSASDTAYAVKCGTSMASPTICGLSALLLEDFRAQYPSRPDFRNSTLKILLAHTAVDNGNAGPDNQFGYGSVRIQPAVDFMRSGNFLESEVSQGGTYNVLVVVNPGDPVMKVTLAWDDVPGTPNVNPALVNDLDLVVFDPSNNQRFPWTLDLANPGNPALQTQANHVDNIEQVFVSSPPPGVYRVEVRGFNVPSGPQPFSLCASPQLVNCSRAGVVLLDRARYNCSATATVRVVDCDLNTDDNVIETVSINVSSTSEGGGESVLLTETGAQTATFSGTIPLSTTNSAGVLQVADGDTITATYIDADDGQGGTNVVRTANAAVDCVLPVISNIQIANLGPRTAEITFDTSEPAKGTVRYGLACGALTSSMSEAAFGTSHSITLSGLNDNTPYFYAIDAVDQAANSVTDDNGGACHTFTTTEIPDPYTEEFAAGDFDLSGRSILFTPNGSIDYYSICSAPITVLPTDPAGGTPLTLADNANANVALTGGAQVSIYSQSFNNFFVGSNGYITFGVGDTDSTPTLADHFDSPRISAMFANLNPALGGTVSWKQLADRALVTFQNVPQASTSNSNTFQIEMYFDGRIRLSFLQMDTTTGITGLSAGKGIPADFLETNLSNAASCGPQPPAAASRSIETPVSIPVDITLIAGDDGLPGPLSYIVTSVPAGQLVDHGNGHVIVSGDLPYTLSGGGNQVTYTPGGVPTSDSFQFKANDGGTPPTGGDSNIATISISVQPVLSLPFFDDFPTTTFDPNKWALVDTATIDSVGLNEPSEPNSARFNGDPNGGDEIRTHLINLAGQTAVRLTYWFEQRGGGESPDAGDDLFVEFLNNTGSWQLIRQHLGADPDMTNYQQVSVLLPASAFHSGFRLRFRNNATSGAFDDWFVDNVGIADGNAPVALSAAVSAPFNGFADFTLMATDPTNDPLTYTIMSLPASGTLKDPGAGLATITTVPYVLVGGGNVVRYTPNTGFGGNDAFTFKVNDGTFDSNVATVNITVEPVLNLPFSDTFPTTTFDPQKWRVVTNATIDDVGIAEPSAPYSARFNGTPTANGDSLQSATIDLSAETAVRLTYWFEQRGGGESPDPGDDLFIEYRDASSNWQILQQHLGADPDMTTYQQVSMLLPPGALHSAFRLRIRCNASASSDDWFVDDISLVQANSPTAADQAISVAVNASTSVTLAASDPNGDPLTWIVTSLPAHGLLKDPNGGIITSVPHTLVASGNVVQYKGTFNYQGTDVFTWKASDGVHESGIANVNVTVGGLQLIHSFPLNSNPGWTIQGGWAFGQPTGGGSHNFDPAGGFTGTNVFGYNLSGDYPNNMGATEYLTTTAINCTAVTGVELRFRRWLGVESSTFDHATIDVSTNGSTWTNVWNHSGSAISEAAWSLQTYVLAPADNQGSVYLRWGMGPTDGSVTYPGWNIDDLEIWGLVPATCPPNLIGDMNQDGSVNGEDIRVLTKVLVDPFLATVSETCAADVNQDNSIDAADAPAMVQRLLTYTP